MGLKASAGISQAQLDQAAVQNLTQMEAMVPSYQLNADWNAITNPAQILNKPTAISTFSNDSGYITSSALSGLVTSSLLTSTLTSYATNNALATVSASIPKIYRGSTLRTGGIVFTQSVNTTVGGVAGFSLTDGSGNALFTNVDYFKAEISDSTNSYNYAYSLSGDKKTLTITSTRSAPTGVISLLGINLLSAPTATPVGTAVNIIVIGS
jgi:hypothetical protein